MADVLSIMYYMSWSTSANIKTEIIAQMLIDRLGLRNSGGTVSPEYQSGRSGGTVAPRTPCTGLSTGNHALNRIAT